MSNSTDHAKELARLQRLARVMDTAFRVPFTKIRFGADSILGLVPGAGDLIGLAISAYAILMARRLGAPRALIIKMIANAGIDAGLGTIPIVGDVFDMFFKSNTKNVKLLSEFIEKTKKP